MLEIIGAGAAGRASKDWSQVWNNSPEAKGVQNQIDFIHRESPWVSGTDDSEDQQNEYAVSFRHQLWHVTYRVFQQYWREPSYVWAKVTLGTLSALFIGFTFFRPNISLQGFEDVLFSAFMLTSVFSTLVQQ